MIQQQPQLPFQLQQRQKGHQDKQQTLQTAQWRIQGNDNAEFVTSGMGWRCVFLEQAQQQGRHEQG